MRQFVKCIVSSNNRDVFRSSVYFLTSKALAKPHQNTSQVGSTVLLHINRLLGGPQVALHRFTNIS